MEEYKGSGGIGFVGMLSLIFIVLKLTQVITWSWVWVLAPIWISVALGVLVSILFVCTLVHKRLST
jgi:hypothetical protein